MSRLSHFLVFFAGFFLVALCTTTLTAQVTFTEVDSGNSYGLNHPGGLMGCAWGDYDNDGDLDMVITGGTNNGAMYRNDISSTTPSDPTRFIEVSGSTPGTGGIIFSDPGGSSSSSAMWVDLNGDGNLDVIMGTLRIFINHLKDSSKFSFQQDLVPVTVANGGWGTTAGDFDGDGDLDLAVSGGNGGTNGYGPIHVFRNDGNGVYVDVANSLLGFTVNREAWNPQWVDVDNDGDLDLWMPSIRNGLEEGCLLLFNKNGTSFETPETGITAVSSIMDSWVDYDNDGDMDLYSVPLGADNDGNPRLYQNDGTGHFTDVAPALGLDSASWVANSDIRSLAWGDYDNDGDLDLFLFMRNGKAPQLWRNDNNGSAFVEVGLGSGLRTRSDDVRTTTFVDYDNDGWLDIFSRNNGSPLPRLFHNGGGNGNHWIVIKPRDTTSNTAGIGARVTLYAGGKMQIRETQSGGGNGNNANIWAHFGLSSATTVDSVIIRFSNGTKVKKTGLAADQYYTVGIVTGVSRNPDELPSSYALSQNYPNPFNPITQIRYSVPHSSYITLKVYDLLGQEVKSLFEGIRQQGNYTATFDGTGLSSAVYLYRMTAGNFSETKKIMLLK